MTAPTTFDSALGPFLERYLALKRALGRAYNSECRVLAHLDRFLAATRADLTAETFAQWGVAIAHLTPTVRRRWMSVARGVCLYRQRSEPATFVPDADTFPRPHPPRRPYLFSEADITRLLRAADQLCVASTSPLRHETFRLALVLLWTAGLRRREVVRLTVGDYDPVERTLAIHATKFHKSRLVPLSADAAREMATYLVARRRLPHATHLPLLCNGHGGLRPYTGAGLAQGLRQLFERAEVRTSEGRLPRVHDLRHSFAHAALRRWYDAGVDVQARLPALARYMGHVSIVSTQLYLATFEPVAAAASARFAQHCAPFVDAAAGGGAP